MRLDKYISKAAYLSRSGARDVIKSGCVCVNGAVCNVSDFKINEAKDIITLNGKKSDYSEFTYIMMNKPSGVLSATEDGAGKTVLDLLDTKFANRGLFPVGRLDKDTVGLMVITDNGPLAHRLLSPKHHVDKTYYLKAERRITEEDAKRLCDGVDIGDGITTLPADFKADTDGMGGYLTIHEGKFHQIKRMLEAVCNKVVFLERCSFGTLVLDSALERGEYRLLTAEEADALLKL